MTQPNILLFMPDQMHRETVGPGGLCHTPNFNALATNGIQFANAFTPTPICTPARASTFTGLLPHQHALLHNSHMAFPIQDELPEGTTTFADALGAAGYETFHVGKWHVGRKQGPNDHGFRTLGGSPAWRQDPATFVDTIEVPNAYEAKGLLAAATTEKKEDTQPWQVCAALADFIRNHAAAEDAAPFCAFASTSWPHVPWICPAPYVSHHDPGALKPWANYDDPLEDKPRAYRKHYNGYDYCWIPDDWPLAARALTHYFGVVDLLDDAFGQVLDALRATGQFENTLVLVTSDHGELMGRHGLFGKNEMLCDDLVRIPLIASWPAHFHGGAHRDEMVTLCDFFPTFLEAAGIPETPSLPGRSLVPLMGAAPAPSDWPKDVYLEHHGDLQYNLVRAIRDEQCKYVYWANDRDEFYDLQADPWEQYNLVEISSHASRLAEYRARLLDTMRTTNDPFLRGVQSNLGNSR